MADLISFYSLKATEYESKLQKVKTNIFYTSVLRLVSFLVTGILIYLYFKFQVNYYILLSFIFLAIFLFLVKKSSTLNATKSLLENLLFVNVNELEIVKGGMNKFDSGTSFHSNESYYADLDIFGEASLFHLINRTSTSHGSTALSQLLKHTYTEITKIREHQKALKAFATQHPLRENIIAKSLLYKFSEGNISNIQGWLNQPSIIRSNKWMAFARFAMPFLNLATLLLSLYLGHYAFLILSVLICWLHIGYFGKYIQHQHNSLGKKQEILEQYAVILKEFVDIDAGGSSILEEHKSLALGAHKQIKLLASLSNLLDQRLNILVNILLNSFLLYDVQVAMALEKWKEENKDNFQKWVGCVASIECLTSLSTFAFNHPDFCYPSFNDDLCIEAKEMAHPLIPEGERITNDISLGDPAKLLLITGSNMSGKTTYLRTLGINIVLAQCGAPVCAKTFSFRPLRIHTSIRISDSLQEHTSYFMAELKRLSEIISCITSLEPSLVLIDEILRGTNSEDKYYGSARFVEKLIRYNCLTLFATHDLKLSELANEHKNAIDNYCFESIIKNEDLIFDYKILKGVAQNKNASFLMKKMKII